MASSEQDEIERLRERFHDMTNALNSAVIKVEITAEKVSSFSRQWDRIETSVAGQNERIDKVESKQAQFETRLGPIEKAKENLTWLVISMVVMGLLGLLGLRAGVHL